jgi:hypothetical protein
MACADSNSRTPTATCCSSVVRVCERPGRPTHPNGSWDSGGFGIGVVVSAKPDCERRDRVSSENAAEGGDTGWGWGSPPACARTNALETRFPAPSSPEGEADTTTPIPKSLLSLGPKRVDRIER